MSRCRLCLNHRKRVISILASENEYTFSDMIASLTSINIDPEDEFTKEMCLECSRKLKAAFKFKIDAERCDAVLHSQDKLKKINFTNLEDFRNQIEFKPIVTKEEDVSNIIKDGETSTTYYNTVITKIEESNSEALTISEFKNFKPEPADDSYDDNDYEMDCNDDGSDSDYMESQAAVKKKQKSKAYKKKGPNNRKKKENDENTFVPITPTFMKDLALVRAKPVTRTRKKKEKEEKEKKDARSICPYCGKLCQNLNSHVLLHTGEKKFSCDKCPKTFFTVKGLKDHTHNHEPNRNFKCTLCVATFYTSVSLKSHMITHIGEKKFVCHICDKGFKRRGTLRRHALRHNFAGKSIKCELCNMSFHEPGGLRHHMRIHTGERPYKCEICSQPYSYKHDFNRHCFKKHGVFLKRRSVYVMNEEVLKQERALMKDLALRAHGVITDSEPPPPFEGGQGAMAFHMAIKAIEARQIPVEFQL